jgi:hypothetical protein
MLSALRWSIWKLRNTIIFKQTKVPTSRNLIILICSLVDYWVGLMDEATKSRLKKWLFVSLEMIPLQIVAPMLTIECTFC